MQHQKSHATKNDRYPNVFYKCLSLKNNTPSILSFGCSTGQEVRTLSDKYFPNSIIHGLDINAEVIETCKKLNINNNVKFFTYDDFDTSQKYDMIFCMSVLCRWEDTKYLQDCSEIYPFDNFDKQLIHLDSILNLGGLLVIYNANFCFSDSSIYYKYTPISDPAITTSGFVKKFDKNNQSMDIVYSDCIFKKNI